MLIFVVLGFLFLPFYILRFRIKVWRVPSQYELVRGYHRASW